MAFLLVIIANIIQFYLSINICHATDNAFNADFFVTLSWFGASVLLYFYWKNITDGKVSKKEGMSQYGNIMEKQFSFEIEKREGASLTILVFSPLSKTKFTLSVKCES